MSPSKIIIDTDPGIDDVLAMLLAFSAKPDELDVLMLSVTFGNVEVEKCLRNVVTLFHHIERERAWRRSKGRPEGFETLNIRKPIVAAGAHEPLAEHMMVADFFHGLGGIHSTHPHLSPSDTWRRLFVPKPDNMTAEQAHALDRVREQHSLFVPSLKPAHEQMLELLREHARDSITIVAVGPLTNLAMAAAADPETFLRVKEVVVMGGAVEVAGNMTPGAEFNTYADSVASARIFALTSLHPRMTMPPIPKHDATKPQLPAYPEALSRRLTVKLFPLDITERHVLYKSHFDEYIRQDQLQGSPLAEWMDSFLAPTYAKSLSLKPHATAETIGLQLHDPLTVWYALSAVHQGWKFREEDVRVETCGQWTRGCIVVDRRGRKAKPGTEAIDAEVIGDAGGWRDTRRANSVQWCLQSPGTDAFAAEFLHRVLEA